MAWTDINKTSAQTAVTEFLDNLEDWVVNSDEKINESPSSFTSLFASTLGKISAYSFFNMLMAKREITPSTAILAKSLLRQLKSDQISGIYGTPSSIQMIISYPKDDIIDKSVLIGNGKYKLTLNKNTTFAIGSNSIPFTLPFNIDIFTTKYTNNGEVEYSTYAMYDTDDAEAGSIVSVNNPYISTRTDAVINNKKMFSMYVDLKQYVRTTTSFDMTGEPQDMAVEYGDHLVGFVVLYKSQSSDTYTQVNTYLEGETYTDGLLYTLTSNGGSNNIKFKFSKLPNSFNPTNGVIKVVVYTTSGADGNFTLGQLDDDTVQDMNMAFNQDISDEAQYQLLNIIPTVSIVGSEASGGANDLDIEGIRKLVLDAGNNEVITPTSLANKAKAAGFSSYKTRHDLFALEYTLSSYLTDGNGYIVPSKNINVHFALSDIDVNTESNSRFITPSDSFTYDSSTKTYAYVPSKSLSPYNVYYSSYKKDKSLEYYNFPFFIRVQNGTSLIATAYDESINIHKETQYTYMSDDIYDKASIISLYAYRNPISEQELSTSTDDNVQLEKDYYRFAFDVYLSDVIYNHLKAIHDGTSTEDEYVKFKLLVKNTEDGSVYEHDIDIKDCTFNGLEKLTVTCYAYLKTSSAVLANGQINIQNSLKGVPLTSTQYGFYYIDPKVDVSVAVVFKNTDETKTNADLPTAYRSYLSTYEQNNGYYVGIIYTVEGVQLCKDISDVIDINTDIKLTQPTYETAEEDIPDVYDKTEYKTDSDGKFETQTITTTLADGSTVTREAYVVLHAAGDTKQELNGRVGCFNASGVDWTWSNPDATGDTETGLYNDGSVLDGSAIRAVVQWNGLVIFGGDDGRVGCYDITYSKWHAYNESDTNKKQYRDTSADDPSTSGYVIKGDKVLGTYTENGVSRNAAIRGMKVVPITTTSSAGITVTSYILIVYGDMGRVVSCRLDLNKWNSFDGTKQNSDGIAIYYNNGSCINGAGEQNALYACEEYSYSETTNVDGTSVTTTKNCLIFAGGSGRVCSLILADANAGWHNYDSDTGRSSTYIFSDGAVRNYKTVLSMSKYLDSILYLTGIDGVVSVIDLTNGSTSLLDDGSSVENNVMYASAMYGNTFIEAGKGGKVASYNITRGTWNISSAGSGLCDNGTYMDDANIYTIISYGINLLFCGEYGRVSTYNTTDSEWTKYDATSDSTLVNTGTFIKNTISCASYDSSNGSNIIYFGGSAGNITYKYRKGDTIYDIVTTTDSNGNTIEVSRTPKIKKQSEQICYLKGIPCYSRLYAIKSNYFDVVEAYTVLMDKIDAMDDIFIDDGNLYLGVKNTSGASETFYFKDPTTNETEYLDSLAISLSLGVKFEDNITTENAEFLVESIKTEIISYIKDLQNTTDATIEFNVNKMLDTIKTDIPSISYFEYYSLNNYDSTKCQTVFHDNSVNDENNEYLCVATTIDELNSDINSQDVVFTPDISITIL